MISARQPAVVATLRPIFCRTDRRQKGQISYDDKCREKGEDLAIEVSLFLKASALVVGVFLLAGCDSIKSSLQRKNNCRHVLWSVFLLLLDPSRCCPVIPSFSLLFALKQFNYPRTDNSTVPTVELPSLSFFLGCFCFCC